MSVAGWKVQEVKKKGQRTSSKCVKVANRNRQSVNSEIRFGLVRGANGVAKTIHVNSNEWRLENKDKVLQSLNWGKRDVYKFLVLFMFSLQTLWSLAL